MPASTTTRLRPASKTAVIAIAEALTGLSGSSPAPEVPAQPEPAAVDTVAQAAAAAQVELWEARVKTAAQAVENARMALAEAKEQLREARKAAKPTRAATSSGPKKVVAVGEVIQRSVARESGATTSVTRIDGGWRMACEAHGSTAERRNRLVAEAEARHPGQWCSGCAQPVAVEAASTPAPTA